MPQFERTAETARKIVMDLHGHEIQKLSERAARILSTSVIEEVFRVAWRHRFDDERKPARREIRDLVRDTIEDAKIGDAV